MVGSTSGGFSWPLREPGPENPKNKNCLQADVAPKLVGSLSARANKHLRFTWVDYLAGKGDLRKGPSEATSSTHVTSQLTNTNKPTNQQTSTNANTSANTKPNANPNSS